VASLRVLAYDGRITPAEVRIAVGEFGNKFRSARESKELSLDDVSNVTKISARMLQAIEEERFDQLPGGVFNRGFIRAYAKHLGLNSEDAVTDYLACLRQAQIDAHEVWQPVPPAPAPVRTVQASPASPTQTMVAPPPSEPEVKPVLKPHLTVDDELPDLQLPRAEHIRPPKRDYAASSSATIPWRIIAAAAIAVFLVILLWTRRSHDSHTVAAKSTAPPTISNPPVATAQTSASPATPSEAASAKPAPSSSSSSATASSATPPVASPAAAQPSKTSASTHAPATVTTPADAPVEKVVEKGDVTIRSFGQPLAKPTDKPAASLSLVIRATETSWISVTSDGQLVTQETLIAPANTTIHATREIVARIGNAAGVTFLWNGQELPSQGAEAEAKTFVFDAQGMREQSAPTPP
jgi:cytoskeletal protein RodZ